MRLTGGWLGGRFLSEIGIRGGLGLSCGPGLGFQLGLLLGTLGIHGGSLRGMDCVVVLVGFGELLFIEQKPAEAVVCTLVIVTSILMASKGQTSTQI